MDYLGSRLRLTPAARQELDRRPTGNPGAGHGPHRVFRECQIAYPTSAWINE